MQKISFSLILLLSFTGAYAESFSMRSCMLLPITDTAGNSLGYKVFEGLEEDLKERGWCEYKPSSEVIGIFSKYRERLPEYLKDENVLKTVADRLKVGTIIRVNLEYEIDKVQVELDIIGENGSDIYMSEKTILNEIRPELILTTVNNWLELYESTIPYDGKVLGVLGDQITFSIPASKRVIIGQDLSIKRLVGKKQHPLLKKIVEWDSNLLAKAKAFNVSKGQGLATIKVYTSSKKVMTGDWVRFEAQTQESALTDERVRELEEDSFGKLGELTLAIGFTSQNLSTNSDNGSLRYGGLLYGIHAEVEAWITRNYFAIGEFSRNLGTLDNDAGDPDLSTSGQNSGTFKVGAGYKYLPLGFFYGPQVNLYGGWVNYSYEMDKSRDDGLGTNSFTGIFVGAGGSIPVKRELRIFGSGEIIPFGEFDDESNIYGSQKSVSSLNLKIGLHYFYKPNIKLLTMFNAVNNSARTGGGNSEVTYRDTALKFGGVFSF